ncbi:MAG TPA: inositol monophosphatase family protein [Ktedonobacterales bacterium]|nr:inositol monophosphatase family protein [Ktedonobacterales bacterium]
MAHTFPQDDHTAAAGSDPRPIFIEMFRAARSYLLNDGQSAAARELVATNPKGEATRAFDAEAERIALAIARERLGSFRAFSEEAGELAFGTNPRWTLVVDPCDGSNNFKRGIRCVGFAVAALPPDAPLDPELVEYAVCGDIFTGTIYSAARGRGATLDGLDIHASPLTILRHAMLGVNIGHDGPTPPARDGGHDTAVTQRFWNLLESAATVRRSGSTVLDLCYVAQGAYSAYVDLRQRLTPENFLAPALVIREAGGAFTGARGQPLGALSFTHPYSVLAAGNDALLSSIVDALYGDERA